VSFQIQAAAAAATAAAAVEAEQGGGGEGPRALLSVLLEGLQAAAADHRQKMRELDCGAQWYVNLLSYYVKEASKETRGGGGQEGGGGGGGGGGTDLIMAREAFEGCKAKMEEHQREHKRLSRGGGGLLSESQARLHFYKAMWHAQELRDMSRRLVVADVLEEGLQLAIDVERFLETGCGVLI